MCDIVLIYAADIFDRRYSLIHVLHDAVSGPVVSHAQKNITGGTSDIYYV